MVGINGCLVFNIVFSRNLTSLIYCTSFYIRLIIGTRLLWELLGTELPLIDSILYFGLSWLFQSQGTMINCTGKYCFSHSDNIVIASFIFSFKFCWFWASTSPCSPETTSDIGYFVSPLLPIPINESWQLVSKFLVQCSNEPLLKFLSKSLSKLAQHPLYCKFPSCFPICISW